MNKFFPDFELSKMEDGRYYWLGTINTGVMGDNAWTLQIVYDNDYPTSKEGGSVKVYTIEPDIEDVLKDLHPWRPYHLLADEGNYTYLCTAREKDVKSGKIVTSAATTLSWAVKWLMSFELVLTGDLTVNQFDKHGGI